jgi:ABC-2 type transport system ATP-binding protein
MMEELALETKGLVRYYPKFMLGPLDVHVPKGAMYGLIGPNGAGKTTFLNLVMSMVMHDAGSIRVFGFDHLKDEVAVKSRVGFVSNLLDFSPWGTVRRVVRYISTFYSDWDDDYCAQLMDRLRVDWAAGVNSLSYGAKVKLNLVMALAHRPPLLLLDEPLSGLDAISRHDLFAELMDAVRDEERTVLISSHDLHDLERFCDNVGIINNGKVLLEGTTSDIVDRFRVFDCAPIEGITRGAGGVVDLEQIAGRWRIVGDLALSVRETLNAHNIQILAESPLTLEEILVALVREKEEWRR